MNGVHRLVVGATGGRVGWEFGGMPALELTTIGRKSGQKRSVMLTAPLVEGETYVIVASRGGDDVHPAWYHNLRANPDVEVSLKGGPREKWHAAVASPEERARMWPLIADKYSNYRGYQERTKREIPLVLLTRREGEGRHHESS
jgi:deazaflavin-dependent oxidoreductase (nitroreductase family)